MKPVLWSKITFSGTCVPYGRMRWDPECPEPRCSSESRPQTPENAYSYVTGKRVFTRHTMIIPTNPSGDYGSTTDTAVGSKVRQFCNENYEFVKVSIPGKHQMLNIKFAMVLDYAFQNSKGAMTQVTKAGT